MKPGGTIVEGTAGNTGIGLTLVGNALGYRSIIVIPETQTQEKKDALRLAGAEVREVAAVPYRDENNYVHVSRRLAEDTPNSIWANQFDNTANRNAHRDTTAQEIWSQTDGTVDGFICAVGTGGTLAGVAEGLRAHKSDVTIGIADPGGAMLYSYYTTGEFATEGGSITEGIGQGRITGNLEGLEVDAAFRVFDADMLPILFDLNRNEGLALGSSSGVNVAGAIRLAEQMGPGHTIVTMLCDGAARYQSKLYNRDFLESKGLPCPDWL